MKQFHNETVPPPAQAVIQVALRVLRMVRAEIARQPGRELTLTEMQALGFLLSNPGASLSELADHLGLQKPTTSKVVEELVQQGRISREVVPENRRKLALNISESGREALELAAEPAMSRMTELLARLTEEERGDRRAGDGAAASPRAPRPHVRARRCSQLIVSGHTVSITTTHGEPTCCSRSH